MRNTTINNTVYVTYPNETIWLNDNNCIKIMSTDGSKVGATITLTNLATTESKTLFYNSDLTYLVFILDDLLKNLYNGGFSYGVNVVVYDDSVNVGYFSFELMCLNGKSFSNKAHGSTRTIYCYESDDLYKLQLYLPAAGTLTVNGTNFNVSAGYNALNLQNAITNYGEYMMCFTNGDSPITTTTITSVYPIYYNSATINLNFSGGSGAIPTTDEKRGDVWYPKFDTSSYCIRLIYTKICDDYNVMKFKYYDCDGLTRYLAGRIINENISANGSTYYNIDSSIVYKNIPHRFITENETVVKIAFVGIRRDSYFNEIILSDKIWFKNYDGEWCECIINSDNIEVDSNDDNDYEIEFTINKEA